MNKAGKLCFLRPLEPNDLTPRYLGWLNDPEVTRYIGTGLFPYTQAQLQEFYQNTSRATDAILYAIADIVSGVHIGNVKLDPILWVHRRATLSILIGDKRFWGRGYGTEATRLIVRHGFDGLNLHRIDLGVLACNERAIRAYRRAGFSVEGCARQFTFVEGRYVDCIWMGLLNGRETKHDPLYQMCDTGDTRDNHV